MTNRGRLVIVVGGCFGSEGKGKAAQYLSSLYSASLSVRAGGINAGHTVGFHARGDHVKFVTRSLPSALAVPSTRLALAPGAIVSSKLLNQEVEYLERTGLSIRSRLILDPNAFVMEEDLDQETESGWARTIGSTQTGTGAALIRRIQRGSGSRGTLVRDDDRFNSYNRQPVPAAISSELDSGGTVLLEGTQGFGLSLFHGPWPTTTSRDTTASALCSECGVAPYGPWDAEICMVIRSFPIRVGGPSGPMEGEISWTDVQEKAGRKDQITEITSVTKRTRRVAEFDYDLFKRAILVNRPNYLALHGADYVNGEDLEVADWEKLSTKSKEFINRLENVGGVKVRLVFTGPGEEELIDRG